MPRTHRLLPESQGATTERRADLILLVRMSEAAQLERLQILVDGVWQAVEQVQDVRLELLEDGPAPSMADVLMDVLLIIPALAPYALLLLKPLIQVKTVAGVKKWINVVIKAVEFGKKAGEFGKSIGKPAPVKLPESSGGDRPGVGMLNSVQTFASKGRYSIREAHAAQERRITTGADMKGISAILESEALPGPELDKIRRRLSLGCEAAIWARLFRFGQKKEDGADEAGAYYVPSSVDQPPTRYGDTGYIVHDEHIAVPSNKLFGGGILSERLTTYWLNRFLVPDKDTTFREEYGTRAGGPVVLFGLPRSGLEELAKYLTDLNEQVAKNGGENLFSTSGPPLKVNSGSLSSQEQLQVTPGTTSAVPPTIRSPGP